MKGRIFIIPSAVSLVLWAGVVGLWVVAALHYTIIPIILLLLVLGAILPCVWLFRSWRHRELRLPGHCKRCGYDLRASKDQCPECGEPIVTVRGQP